MPARLPRLNIMFAKVRSILINSYLCQSLIGVYQHSTANLSQLPYLHHRKVRILVISSITGILTLTVSLSALQAFTGSGRISCPNEQPLTIPGTEKKLVQPGPRHVGECITPQAIIMHTTAGGTLDSNWDYFNSGANGSLSNAQFIIGDTGKIYQTVEMYQTTGELAWTSNYANGYSFGIEMAEDYILGGKEDMKTEQYQAALNLVCTLMKQYNIPLGTTEADWVNTSQSASDANLVPGIYGHYQIWPSGKEDPGRGWLTDFRADLKAGNCGSAASVTSTGTGGRIVPYDRYARPYSWPMTGTIIQNYGFTEQAQSLGKRFPGLYPLGDPNVVFSVTNHTEPPLDPTKSKYINPNIDIAPDNTSASSRAVYATHAGWITFADWAGPEKGYTIQIEADVEGDGQADLGTRYMRLQAPAAGYFAPDIALFKPSNQASPTINGNCTVPQNNDWANVNKWDEQVKQGIATIKTVENLEVPCNLVKAFMKLESNGIEHPPNASGYMGLMQVATSAGAGGGSNCDWITYDVTTTQGNINCGIQEIARGYKYCNNSYDGAILKYFTGGCENDGASDIFGTDSNTYLTIVKQNWTYLDSQVSQTPAPAIDNTPNPSPDEPKKTEVKIPPIQTIEAEDMKLSGGNQTQVVDDGAASLSKAILFKDTAVASTTIKQKADRIAIVAKATANTFCPSNATMRVSLDDGQVEDIPITSNIYKSYYIDTPNLDGSSHDIRIQLLNPRTQVLGVPLPGCQRQLSVDSLNLMVTNPNTPTVTTVSEKIIEVEDMDDKTEGNKKPKVITDNQASKNKYVAFTSNGKYSQQVDVSPKANNISIRGRGDFCEDHSTSPMVVVKINDQEVFKVGLNQRTWSNFSTDLKLPTTPPAQNDPAPQEGETESYTVSIEFVNDDQSTLTCDLNAYLDTITFTQYETSQSTATATSLIGKTKYVARNQLIGYVSNSRGTSAERAEYGFKVDEEDPQNYYNTVGQVPNPSQAYLSYRIMYNNPNLTTFPQPDQADAFINAKVDNPYIVETDDNTVAGSLKTSFQEPLSPMYFFCALRTTGNSVKCINTQNP